MPIKSLQAAEHGAVDHDGRMFRAVLPDVEGAEPHWKVEVELHRAALPLPPDSVAERVFKLRSVERALAGADGVGMPDLLQRHFERGFRLVPDLVRPDPLLRPRRQLDDHILEAEVAIDRQDHVVHLDALVDHLILGAEDVRVVLREVPHAHDAMQRAGWLVAMHLAELGDA